MVLAFQGVGLSGPMMGAMTNDNAPGKFHVGDTFPIDLLGEADCPALATKSGLIAACILDSGHDGQHIAVGFESKVVEVWG